MESSEFAGFIGLCYNTLNMKTELNPNCEKCEKPNELCVCPSLKTLENRRQILILQHPQEPDKDLGTAQLVALQLKKSKLKTGLSWRSLRAILENEKADPKRWGVLYLGAGSTVKTRGRTLLPVDKKGAPFPEPLINENLKKLEGIIVIDGTWSQAKTLWWRNAWLLKSQRLILQPKSPSLYGKLRKEPKSECLSTLESVAEVLDALGEDASIGNQLRSSFSYLLEKYKVEYARREAEKKAQKAANKAVAANGVTASDGETPAKVKKIDYRKGRGRRRTKR
jgi:DTW domain-containing protein